MGYVGTKVTQNIVSTSEITDGTITNDDLASDIAITTTGDTSLKGNVVINEDSADKDFRVESNGNANMLFVDGGNDKVGIGTGSPNDYYAKDLVVNSADEGGITILNSSTHAGGLFFADGTSAMHIGHIFNMTTTRMQWLLLLLLLFVQRLHLMGVTLCKHQ